MKVTQRVNLLPSPNAGTKKKKMRLIKLYRRFFLKLNLCN